MLSYLQTHINFTTLTIGVVIINIALSAAQQILSALHKVSPPWLAGAIGFLKKITDWISANQPHPQDQAAPTTTVGA